jgi:hypothetical protein
VPKRPSPVRRRCNGEHAATGLNQRFAKRPMARHMASSSSRMRGSSSTPVSLRAVVMGVACARRSRWSAPRLTAVRTRRGRVLADVSEFFKNHDRGRRSCGRGRAHGSGDADGQRTPDAKPSDGMPHGLHVAAFEYHGSAGRRVWSIITTRPSRPPIHSIVLGTDPRSRNSPSLKTGQTLSPRWGKPNLGKDRLIFKLLAITSVCFMSMFVFYRISS